MATTDADRSERDALVDALFEISESLGRIDDKLSLLARDVLRANEETREHEEAHVALIEAVLTSQQPLTANDLTVALDLDLATVRHLLARMSSKGRVYMTINRPLPTTWHLR